MKTLAKAFCIFAIVLGSYCVLRSADTLMQITLPSQSIGIFLFCLAMLLLSVAIFGSQGQRLPPGPLLCLPDSSIGKTLQAWRNVAVLFSVMIFFYGIIVYLDAPIRPTGDGTYIGKSKKKHYTRAEYEAFLRWESALLTAWPGMLLLCSGVGTGVQTRQNRKVRNRKAGKRKTQQRQIAQ